MVAQSNDDVVNNSKNLEDYTQEELKDLDSYAPPDGNSPNTQFYDQQPVVDIPQATIDEATNVPARGSREKRFRTWAIIQGWRTNPTYVNDAYGPTVTPEQSFLEDGIGAGFPNGFIYYENILTPCGTYIAVYPDAMSTTTTSVSIASLPAGLSVCATNGLIYGTPTTVQDSARYVASGFAANGGSCRTTFNIEVYNASDYPVINYRNNNVAATGIAFTLTPTTWTIPTGSIPTINPNLPTGLSFTSATGVVSGTATTPQAKTVYTVRANGTGTISNITVGDAFNLAVCGVGYPSALYSFVTTGLATGVNHTITPTVWTGIGAATLSPTLPTGLSFTSATGVISGTPTVVTQAKVYSVDYRGSGAYASVSGSVDLSFLVSTGGNVPNTIDYSIQAITTSATDWGNDIYSNFSGLFKITDYTVSPPSSVTLLCGKAQNIHPLGYIIERATNYRCNIYMYNGSYPGFVVDTVNAWHGIYKTTGIRGVRLIGETSAGVKIQTGQLSMYFRSLSGTASNPVNTPGAMRDWSFSNIYFSGTSGLGVDAIFIQPNVSGTCVPGLHFYNCTFDGQSKPVKWLFRDYNAVDRRFINCIFKDNWTARTNTTAAEHAYYNTGDFGVNFFENCVFSGIGRNAIQAAGYRNYTSIQSGTNYVPRPVGGWVIRNCQAIQCGMSNWSLNPTTNTPVYTKNSYGSVYYTFAGVSAVHLLGCTASGGYHTVANLSAYDFNKGTGALVIWKNPNTIGYSASTLINPEFYGNKIAVVSACSFFMKQAGGDFDLMNLKNVRQLWVSGGTYYHPGMAIFQLSSHEVNGTAGNESQGYNPNNLPYIASSFFTFPLTTATFPGGYPPYVKANCLPYSNCTVLSQTVFEALVNAADQPIPTAPTKPTDGTFLYQAGFTHPITGVFTA